MDLLTRIERHLKITHMAATRFGRRAVGDPRFVLDLRAGRRPRLRTVQKVTWYLDQYDLHQELFHRRRDLILNRGRFYVGNPEFGEGPQ